MKFKKQFKTIAYLNILLGIILLLSPLNLNFTEKLLFSIMINAAYYFVFYLFIMISDRFPVFNRKSTNSFSFIVLEMFAIYGILMSLIVEIIILINVFVKKDYEVIFMVFIPFGMFIGAYNLWIKIHQR